MVWINIDQSRALENRIREKKSEINYRARDFMILDDRSILKLWQNRQFVIERLLQNRHKKWQRLFKILDLRLTIDDLRLDARFKFEAHNRILAISAHVTEGDGNVNCGF